MTLLALRPTYSPSPPVGAKVRIPSRLWPAIIVGYATLLPKELSFEIAGGNFFPWRIAALLVLPWVLRSIFREPLRPSYVDAAAALAGIWSIIPLIINDSLIDAIAIGGSQMIDAGLIYAVGRSAVRSRQDIIIWFGAMIPGLLTLGLVLAAESLSGRLFFRQLIGDLVGRPALGLYNKPRFGMVRAIGPFAHPIMAGVVAASLLPIAWYMPRNLKARYIGIFVAGCSVFTLSSTTVLAGAIGILFIVLFAVRRHLHLPTITLFLIYLGLFSAIITIVSENGILSWAIRNLTLDAGSGYYRILIWNYAGAEALNSPMFGIGLRDWDRPAWMFHSTVDSYWLVTTMRYGFPLSLAIMLMMLGAIFEAVRGTARMSWEEADIAHGLAISIGIFAFCGISVHIWEGAASWMFLLPGFATSLGTQRTNSEAAEPPALTNFNIPQPGQLKRLNP